MAKTSLAEGGLARLGNNEDNHYEGRRSWPKRHGRELASGSIADERMSGWLNAFIRLSATDLLTHSYP